MSTPHSRVVSTVLILAVSILVVTNLFSLRALNSLSGEKRPAAPILNPLEQDGTTLDASLFKAIVNLDGRIDDLCRILSSTPSQNQETTREREPLTPSSEPSLEDLEAAIDRLARVISRSGFTSERNTELRERYDSVSQMKPVKFNTLYTDKGTARKALMLMTYTQILEKFGAPDDIYTRDGYTVIWNYYPNDQIQFVDGYVSRVYIGK